MLTATFPPILTRIHRAQASSSLASDHIRLVAASKGQGLSQVEAAIAAGITAFGENRVQEAEHKWPALKAAHPAIRLHLIGPLQTNKVADAVALFDVIETVDRPKLALALSEALMRQAKHPTLYIQVNTGEESQKSGIAPKEADDFIRYCRDTLHLPIRGVMCVPPVDFPTAPHFALLRAIALRNGLEECSMGMSEDFETAIRMGATEIRLGRILFGERA